jgi:hypothetical protein
MLDLKILKAYMKLFAKIETAIMLVPITVAFYNRNYLNRPLKIFLWFCIAKFSVNFIHQSIIWIVTEYQDKWVPILNKWQITDTNFMGILAYLTNFGFLGWYFYQVIPHDKIAKGIRWLSMGLFIFAIIDYLFIEDFRAFGIFNPSASAIFCFILPLIHLWFLYREDSRVPLSKNPYFWISMGLLIPNLVGCFLHFVGNGIYDADFPLFTKITIGRSCLSMFGQILLAIGFNNARFAQFLPLRDELK